MPDAPAHGPVATEIYLRVDPDTQDFTSHLPILLIHTFESGTLDAYGTDHVGPALQVFEPASGTSRIVGRATVDACIGIHVRGETSRRFDKKQYAMELRAAPRTRFAEVFMVDDGGDVRAASFLGFLTLIEKIERGPERVNVSRLPASAASPPAITGGFILRIDKRLLFRDPAFSSRYKARFRALLNGELSAGNLDRIVDAMTSEVGDAAERNFRRWSQYPAEDNSHAAEIARLKDFLRRRVSGIKTQLDSNF